MKLIFLHYFGGGARSWDGVIGQLGDDYAVQTLDLRELGRLPDGYSVQQAATDVMRQMGEQSEPFVLVGHSMGGKIAVAIAARGPENLRGIVLIAPSPPTPEPMDDEMRAFMLEGHGTREGAAKIVRGAAGGELKPDVWQAAIAANLAYSDRDWGNWINIGTREDISDVVPNVTVPALVIAGELDGGMPADFLREFVVEKLADAQLVELAGAGHLVPQQHSASVAQTMRRWIGQLSPLDSRG